LPAAATTITPLHRVIQRGIDRGRFRRARRDSEDTRAPASMQSTAPRPDPSASRSASDRSEVVGKIGRMSSAARQIAGADDDRSAARMPATERRADTPDSRRPGTRSRRTGTAPPIRGVDPDGRMTGPSMTNHRRCAVARLFINAVS
jgi:hypothetical protein